MGLCKSCIEKYKKKYLARGFDDKTAEHMAVKLLKRVRRRQRYDILKGLKSTFMCNLYRWCFLTQWRATLLASFRSISIMWIGRGFNPDYTQNCDGNCTTTDCWNYAGDCGSANDCLMSNPPCISMGSCACPAPLANSTQVLNECTCVAVGDKCTTCSMITQLCTTRTYTCPCAGTCGYNCDTGYSWNGSQCVESVAKAPVVNGLVYAD